MSKLQRIKCVVWALMMVLFGVILIFFPDEGLMAVATIFGVLLIIAGIRALGYYFQMARYMVGGRVVLFRGIILLDLGAFTMTLTDIPRMSLVLYLLGSHALAGAVDILRALEAKRLSSPSWRSAILFGTGNILVAAAAAFCGIKTGQIHIPMYLYCGGLFYAALGRLRQAFRKTEIIYIP